MVKILDQKNRLDIFNVFLNFFSHATKFWIFFKDLVGIFKLVSI